MKSDKARGLLTRAYERQHLFTKDMVQDYSSSILFLSTVLERVILLPLRTIILLIKSIKFLSILLFHSVNRIWNKMRYTSWREWKSKSWQGKTKKKGSKVDEKVKFRRKTRIFKGVTPDIDSKSRKKSVYYDKLRTK